MHAQPLCRPPGRAAGNRSALPALVSHRLLPVSTACASDCATAAPTLCPTGTAPLPRNEHHVPCSYGNHLHALPESALGLPLLRELWLESNPLTDSGRLRPSEADHHLALGPTLKNVGLDQFQVRSGSSDGSSCQSLSDFITEARLHLTSLVSSTASASKQLECVCRPASKSTSIVSLLKDGETPLP